MIAFFSRFCLGGFLVPPRVSDPAESPPETPLAGRTGWFRIPAHAVVTPALSSSWRVNPGNAAKCLVAIRPNLDAYSQEVMKKNCTVQTDAIKVDFNRLHNV